MNGASRWLDACAGPVHGATSAAANRAAATAFGTWRFRVSADMEWLLEHSSIEGRRAGVTPSAGTRLPVATPSRAGFVAVRAVGRYTRRSGEWMRRLRRNAGANEIGRASCRERV